MIERLEAMATIGLDGGMAGAALLGLPLVELVGSERVSSVFWGATTLLAGALVLAAAVLFARLGRH
jgi:hypothetical protein